MYPASTAGTCCLLLVIAGGSTITRSYAVAGTCAGTVPVNCPGGNLASPVYLNLTRSAVAVALVPGTDRYDFSATLAAATATGIPITLPTVGACTLNINSASGTSPTVVLTGSVTFASQTPNGPIDRLDFSNLAASGLENADVSITGGIGCTVAGLVTTILVAQIASILTQVPSLCAAPGPALLEICAAQP